MTIREAVVSETRPRARTQPVMPFGLAGRRTRYQVGVQSAATCSSTARST